MLDPAGVAREPQIRPDDSRRTSTLLGLLFGIAGMGTSSASIALVPMAVDLDVTIGVATWVISLYVLALAVTTALYGRVADLMGVRVPLLAGVSLMAVGAITASLAPAFGVVVVARVLQGMGAAAIPTLGVTLLTTRYEGSTRGLALGRLSGVSAAVTATGPLAGGVIEHFIGWRAVMMLPVVGMLVLPFLLRALLGGGTGASLDLLGAVLVSLTAGGVILVVQSPSTGITVAAVGLGLMLVGTPSVVWRVRRRPHGFLPREVISNATVLRSAVAAAAVPASWFALLVAVPAVLIDEGWETWEIGLLLLPSAAVGLVMPPTTGWLIDRFGPFRTIATACAVAAAALLTTMTGVSYVVPGLLLVSIMLTTVAFGVGQPAMGAAVGEAVAPEVRGIALGVATLMFMVGGAVGSAVVGGLGPVIGVPQALGVMVLLPLIGLAAIGRLARVTHLR